MVIVLKMYNTQPIGPFPLHAPLQGRYARLANMNDVHVNIDKTEQW
jgi:hypothetical protein